MLPFYWSTINTPSLLLFGGAQTGLSNLPEQLFFITIFVLIRRTIIITQENYKLTLLLIFLKRGLFFSFEGIFSFVSAAPVCGLVKNDPYPPKVNSAL